MSGEYFRWGAVAFFLTAGLGVLSMSSPDYLVAKLFLSIAGILLTCKIGWWFGFGQPPVGEKLSIIFAFLLFGSVGSLWLASMLWIDSREPGQRKAAINERSATFRERPPDVFNVDLGSNWSAVQYKVLRKQMPFERLLGCN